MNIGYFQHNIESELKDWEALFMYMGYYVDIHNNKLIYGNTESEQIKYVAWDSLVARLECHKLGTMAMEQIDSVLSFEETLKIRELAM